jgi:hypothetical protein
VGAVGHAAAQLGIGIIAAPAPSGPASAAGELQFIDWDDTIEPDTPTLKWERETRLAMKLVDPPAVIEDHLLDNYGKGLSCPL